MVQSYSPGGTSVPSHKGTLVHIDLTCAFLGPPVHNPNSKSIDLCHLANMK